MCELLCVCVSSGVRVCVCKLMCVFVRENSCVRVYEQTVGGNFTSGGCSFPTDSVTEPSAFICPGT